MNKLNIGCGGVKEEGFIGIDLRSVDMVDIIARAEESPIKDGCIDRIESYHLIEHLPHPIVPLMLKLEWYRVLKEGGTLVIECPDFDKTIKEYMEGNEDRIYNVYGLQRFSNDCHYFGYNFKRLSKLLVDAGFKNIRKEKAMDYHSKGENYEPCLRVTCQK